MKSRYIHFGCVLLFCDNLILCSWPSEKTPGLSGSATIFVSSLFVLPNSYFRHSTLSNSIKLQTESINQQSSYTRPTYQSDSTKNSLLRQSTGINANLFATPSKNQEVADMNFKDIREELESYGISTKSFFEKREFVEALEKARSEGKVSINDRNSKSEGSTSSSSDSSSESSSSGTKVTSKEILQKANSMKVNELKKELQSMGISTNTFFEKSEFVKAYVDAIQSGKKASSTSSAQSSKQSPPIQEPFDSSYRDVVMQKMDKRDPRLLQGTVIDVRIS